MDTSAYISIVIFIFQTRKIFTLERLCSKIDVYLKEIDNTWKACFI